MKEVDYLWLQDHPHILTGGRITVDERQQLYDIYNSITGENKRPGGCGRCLANVRKRVFVEYDRYENIS